MTAPFNPNLLKTFAPPVMEARRWLRDVRFHAARPLLNLSQAAPVDPPPEALRRVMAEAVLEEPASHLYGPVLGLPDLRAEVAVQWAESYGAGEIPAEAVAITSGCNQAFCAAIQSLAEPGDEVILPLPWYFNHKMWLDMAGVGAVTLPCGPDMIPRAADAAALITPRTRAIALVSPNNPTGAEYPPEVLRAFYTLARDRGVALIVDETYRDFHSHDGPPHDLFAQPDWADVLVHLYSFSKVFRLTGHRIGAMIAAPERLAEIEKFLATMSICPNQIGQRAALHGLRHMGDWVAGERAESLKRRRLIDAGFADLPDWRVLCSGAYFAYVEHPFDEPSDQFAQRLVAEQSLLVLPGTMFHPGPEGARQLRIAFANADETERNTLFTRLRAAAS